MQFNADPRTGSSMIDACGNGCCCETGVVAPGETARVRINYAAWMAEVRARSLIVGRTDISVDRISVSGTLVGSDLAFSLATPGTLTASVALASDIAGASYALSVPPKFGTVVLATNGGFTYTVDNAVASPDLFMVAVTMGGNTIMRRVGLDLSMNVDFAFVARPERPYVGRLTTADTPTGARFVLAGATSWSPIYNGPQTPIGDPPNDVPTLIARPSGFVTSGQCVLGHVQVRSDGAFFYAPNDHVSGVDGFVVDIYNSDGTLWKSVTIAIDIPSLWIDRDRIDIKGPFLHFPVAASRDARIGDAWRVTLFQSAIDCDGCTFVHRSCYDITVARC